MVSAEAEANGAGKLSKSLELIQLGLTDLELTITPFSPARYKNGQDFNVSLKVRNIGASVAESVAVRFPVPAGMTVQSASMWGVPCTGTTELVCSATTIGRFSSVSADIVVLPPLGLTVSYSLPVVVEASNAPTVMGTLDLLPPALCSSDVQPLPITLSEGFATAFKVAGVPSFLTGQTQWEAGYHAPGSGLGGGIDQGTRFRLVYNGLPPGTAVDVPIFIDTGSPGVSEDGLALRLVESHYLSGAGGTLAPGSGMTSIPAQGGFAVAVYEVVDSDPFSIEQTQVAAVVHCGAQPGSTPIDVAASLAPVSNDLAASTVASVPRFLNTIPPGEDPGPGCPAGLVLANQTLSGTQTLEATSIATLGPNLIVNGANIVVNAPLVTIFGGTEISGVFSFGNITSCP